jgi:hypothetical protein
MAWDGIGETGMDDWPDVTKQTVTELTWPDGTTLDVQVKPCGAEAWSVWLVIWPAILTPKIVGFYIELQDCLDVSKLPAKSLDPSRFSHPEYLVDDMSQALAHVVAEKSTVKFDHDNDNMIRCVLIGPCYESKALVSWPNFAHGIRNGGG